MPSSASTPSASTPSASTPQSVPAPPVHEPDGLALLQDPSRTKGTAFTRGERLAHHLMGLLPTNVKTLDEQVARLWRECRGQASDLDQYVFLRNLQDRNEVLFYRLVGEHIAETLPLIYTPTVAEACAKFSAVYRRPRGLYLAYPDRQYLREALRNRPHHAVDVIVVTDGQRILGIGDQGIGGMGIPIGKLSLYTAIGGLNPARTLPIILDVGTDNPALLGDPEYLGWRHERIGEDAYFDFVDEFVRAVKAELPGVLLQWEDFATPHALPLLERYRDQLLTFNDDIQGTAAVALGALQGATRVTGRPLREQNVVMVGAGSAGVGVIDMIAQQMVDDGLSVEQARDQIWVVDVHGLLTDDRADLSQAQRRYAQPRARIADWAPTGLPDLTTVVENVDVGVLLGLSTATGAFGGHMVRTLAARTKRPIIFPLSNPTSRSEARPVDLDFWTEGRALVATGSPFPPLTGADGRRRPVAQCNNVYIFPAMGLAVVASRATRVTDAMMRAAARALGDASPALADPAAPLLPAWERLPEIASDIALAVARQAVADGVAPERDEDALRAAIRNTRWTPEYPDYSTDSAGSPASAG
ncbi:MAG TPA: NAD-dependent malic enzyme [Pseudonocardiaceae bacterium]